MRVSLRKILPVFVCSVLLVGAVAESFGAGKKPKKIKKCKTAALIVWDGEKAGASAKGWSAPTVEDGGATWSVIEPSDTAGKDSAMGLVWKTEGADWKGFGWNWYGWWPNDGGDNITKHSHLALWMKVVAEARNRAPDPNALTLSLRCSGNEQKQTGTVNIGAYVPEGADLLDGEWHRILIPLIDLLSLPESKAFDPKTAWEFGLGTWSPALQKFEIHMDDIGFECP